VKIALATKPATQNANCGAVCKPLHEAKVIKMAHGVTGAKTAVAADTVRPAARFIASIGKRTNSQPQNTSPIASASTPM